MTKETPIYLMSPPRADWCLRGKANFRSQSSAHVDAEKAQSEWVSLANAIVEAGGEVVVCPPNPKKNLTGMVYMAEAGEFFAEEGKAKFLLPNMAAAHRQTESDWIGGFVAGLGIEPVAIRSTWESQGDALRARGGDSIVHTFGSGKFARTTQSAYNEVAHLLSDSHIQIHFSANPWFHGNTFLGIYESSGHRLAEPAPKHGVLVCPDALLPGEFDRLKEFLPDANFVEITPDQSRAYDTNSLQVNNVVIASATISDTAKTLFSDLDLKTRTIDLSELFNKGGGAPVCLTNRLWGATQDLFPARVLWSNEPNLSSHFVA